MKNLLAIMHAMFRSIVFPEGCGRKASSSEPEYINYVDDMHDISGESWREANQHSREPKYINAVGQLHPVTTETRCQVEDYSQQLDNLTKNFGTNPTNEHNDDSLEGLLPCDLFFEEDDYDHEEGYSQGCDTSEEESLTSKTDDNYETLILEVLCDGNPPCFPPDDKYLESWVPCDIFETQLFEEDCFE